MVIDSVKTLSGGLSVWCYVEEFIRIHKWKGGVITIMKVEKTDVIDS